jgi:predicted porin
MNKKLLPKLVGVILAGGAMGAQADITLFGHIDTSFDFTDQDGGEDDLNFNCTTCSVGFKGSEDLGNGLKAIFSLDFQYDTTERNPQKRRVWADTIETFGPSTDFTTKLTKRASVVEDGAITDRDQWLGLAGGFGQVRIGTISTGYKSHGAMIDPLYRTALQGRDRGLQSRFHSGAGEDGQGRAESTIRYDSPSWNGLKVVAHYTLDTDQNDGVFSSTNLKGEEDDDAYGLGASYENGGMLVFADYITNNGDKIDNPFGDVSAWKVGGKYSMGMFGVMGQYEESNSDDGTPLGDVDTTVWHLGATATLGNTSAYFAYGQGEFDVSGGSTDDYDSWTLALMHSLSKRTMLYTGFSEVDCDEQVSGTVCSDVHSTSGGEDDKFSLGMKHKF